MVTRNPRTSELSAPQIPGFNAGASLYVSSAVYRARGGSAGTLGAVQPTYFISRGALPLRLLPFPTPSDLCRLRCADMYGHNSIEYGFCVEQCSN
jgi:hypothetical protein